LEELVLKARYVSKEGLAEDISIAESIIRDLLAIGDKATAATNLK
jgi:hypothetical protein